MTDDENAFEEFYRTLNVPDDVRNYDEWWFLAGRESLRGEVEDEINTHESEMEGLIKQLAESRERERDLSSEITDLGEQVRISNLFNKEAVYRIGKLEERERDYRELLARLGTYLDHGCKTAIFTGSIFHGEIKEVLEKHRGKREC